MPTSPSWRGLPFFLTQSRRPALNDVHTREMGGGQTNPHSNVWLPVGKWESVFAALQLGCPCTPPLHIPVLQQHLGTAPAPRHASDRRKKSAWEEMRPHCIAATKMLGRGHCWDEKKRGGADLPLCLLRGLQWREMHGRVTASPWRCGRCCRAKLCGHPLATQTLQQMEREAPHSSARQQRLGERLALQRILARCAGTCATVAGQSSALCYFSLYFKSHFPNGSPLLMHY